MGGYTRKAPRLDRRVGEWRVDRYHPRVHIQFRAYLLPNLRERIFTRPPAWGTARPWRVHSVSTSALELWREYRPYASPFQTKQRGVEH